MDPNVNLPCSCCSTSLKGKLVLVVRALRVAAFDQQNLFNKKTTKGK